MTWITRVPAWVIPLLADYLIPDTATVTTGVELANLTEPRGPVTLSGNNRTAEYPGLIPDYSLVAKVDPTVEGVNYNLQARKAVGFYGLLSDVLSFDDKRINRWEFPLVRRNFGHLSMSRGLFSAYSEPIHYQEQIHLSTGVLQLVSNYDEDFSEQSLLNNADKFSLDRADVFLYPSVVLQLAFLPIWEVWAVKFFRPN